MCSIRKGVFQLLILHTNDLSIILSLLAVRIRWETETLGEF
jgi:hypothetical protein